MTEVNPFLTPSPCEFELPDFSAISEDHFLPAFEAGMAEQLVEVEDIVASGEPTFADTVVALERSGRTLDRVSRVFFTRVGAHTSPRIQEIEAEVAPKLAAHRDAIMLDAGLFARLDALHERRAGLGLDPESLRLLERHHRDAVRAGARLGAADQERLRALNAELSTLSTEFGARLLAGANAAAVHVTDPARLDGMSADAISAAAGAARDRGHDGGYLITLVLPTGQPVLASLTDRSLREEVFRASVERGSRPGPHDTRGIVRRLVALRAERARLLGYRDHASYVIDDATAGTAEAAGRMLADLVPAAVANADAEVAELDGLARADLGDEPLRPWDHAFYAERVRRERFDVDGSLLRPYLELERVIHDGVFRAARRLYGCEFTERTDLPAYHPDVRYWEVRDADGSVLGLFGADLFARATKRGGAWASSLVPQSSLLGRKPVVLNTANLVKPAPGEPALLTLDEVRTLFHEFGHALHGLFSAVEYPTFSGTAVPRDFVEFPSQVNEMWLEDPEVLASFARHHETGEPMPAELLAAALAARGYGEGQATTEYLAASLLDQAWHTVAPDGAPQTDDDVLAFEAAALERAGVAHPLVPPRYRTAYFNHVFAGGYSAAYYSYIWAEVLDADTVAWFAEQDDPLRERGDRFRREVLSRGGSVDPMEAYRAFRGADPQIEHLLRRRGLAA